MACCPGREQSVKPTLEQDTAAISKVRNDYVSLWKAGMADGVAGLYTDDAVVLYPNQPAVKGRNATVEYLKNFYDQFTPINFDLVSEEVVIAGIWAFDRGTYKLTIRPKGGGTAINDEGKYLVILQRQSDGSVKVVRDMDNSSIPTAQPTANPGKVSP